jgi:hypothetical protein
MAMKMKNMKMPAPKSAKDPMLEMDEMDMELNLPDAMAEEDSAEEMDMGEESQEEASQLADVSDEELQKELEARGFSISKAEAEMDMEESEEEEA